MWDLWNPPQLAVQNRENCQEQTQQPSWSHGLPWEAHWYVVSQPSITLLICIRGLCSDDLNPRLLVAALFMLQKNVCCQNRQCPTHFCTATRSDLWTRSVRYPCEGVLQDGEPQCSAACDDLPGCTALAMTNAGNLWHLDADEEERNSERKTRCSYFSLMMLLCAWRLRPKYLSHNSYLVLGRQHYCSAGGRERERLSGPQRVLLWGSSL